MPPCSWTGRPLHSGRTDEMKIRGNILGERGCWEVSIEAGVITRVDHRGDSPSRKWILPGLFDIQVNGYKGVSLTSAQLKIEDVVAVEREMVAHGVLRWCPTVITAPPEIVEHSLKTIRQAEEQGLVHHVHCIHLEALYLSAEDGYRGIHPAEFLHDADVQEFDALQKAAGGRIGLVTLAPERNGALAFISHLTRNSIRVALGHFNADEKTIQKAVAAGASLSTHLFNGAASMMNRHANVIYSQLAQDALWASFIPDGYHVPYSTLKVGLRSKGISRSIFTSDTISYGGLPPGIYQDPYGRNVIVQDGGIWLEGGEYLYGAWQNLMQGIQKSILAQIVDVETALQLAALNPARYFGIDAEIKVRVGQETPLLVFDAQTLEYQVC